MIQQWWQGLSERERRIVSVGGIAAVILLVYWLIWSPLTENVNQMKSQVIFQQNTYRWMQRATQQIGQLKQAGFSDAHHHDEAILVLVERALAQQKLSLYLRHVQQPQGNQLVLTFHKVPFDRLMSCLQTLAQEVNIEVLQFNASKTKVIGAVDAQVTLEQT